MLESLLSFIYPKSCLFCGTLMGKDSGDICEECLEQAVLTEKGFCLRCGYKNKDCQCGDVPLDEVISVFLYTGSVRKAIQRFKFENCPENAQKLASFQWERVKDLRYMPFDFVISVPMYPKKERARGYNQSELLAMHLADWLKIPFADKALKKNKNHTPLHELSARQRKTEIEGTFSLGKDGDALMGKRLLLVDDVYTTGATMNECAKVLKVAGAKTVSGIVLATTDFPRL